MQPMSRGVPIYIVDAFTDTPFAGNPAGVCLLVEPADERWMQQVAAELNLSETAFVRPIVGGFELRWFTPAMEVELCGHATLAAAHLLWSRELTSSVELVRFETQHAGPITCTREATGMIGMDFPLDVPTNQAAPEGMIDALGVPGDTVANTSRARYDWLVELVSEQRVREAQPDFAQLAKFDCRGVAITARAEGTAGGDFDIVSRFFAPRLRIDEDPVTGSVHCALGPYWRDRLGRSVIHAHQASPRGGAMRVSVGDERVELAGQAVTVLAGDVSAMD